MSCYRTELFEFHVNHGWVFIDCNGEIAHMPTDTIRNHCFGCGRTWIGKYNTINRE